MSGSGFRLGGEKGQKLTVDPIDPTTSFRIAV